MADTFTPNFAIPIPDASNTLQESRAEIEAAFTLIDGQMQQIVNQQQAPDAGTLGGQDLAFVLALANATGLLPVAKVDGFDAAWEAKLAAALSVAPAALDTILEIVTEVQDNDSAIAAINTVIAGKAPNAREIAAGTGLTGGGDLSADRTINADVATAAEIQANVADKLLTAPNVYAAAAPVTLMDEATIALDLATGKVFQVTLGASRDLGNPTNVPVGNTFVLFVKQDATGSRMLSTPSNIKMADGEAIDLSTDANAEDAFSGYCRAADEIFLFPIGKAFS